MEKRILSFIVVLALFFSVFAGTIPAEAATKATGKAPDFSTFDWWETKKSTCFCYVGYDEDQEALAVIFRSNDTRTYVYDDFTAEDFEDFFSAKSLGSYYNKNIKGVYSCTRYDDVGADMFK
ncbi:MAG: KTSC domain-containing protein [Oscillospiraceae bacterium]|nr:KTSC domain-containing protein [Oscillospiraceae bacterium]